MLVYVPEIEPIKFHGIDSVIDSMDMHKWQKEHTRDALVVFFIHFIFQNHCDMLKSPWKAHLLNSLK